MNTTHILAGIAIGLGATLTIDLWGLLLKRVFAIPSLNYCLLGRWVLHMPDRKFVHARISDAAGKPHECRVGWTTHYLIGVTLAVVFVSLVSAGWLARPTLLPALAFGVATVVMPFFTIQPAFGFGIASSKTPHPNKARLKSVTTHTVFGVGLWLWASLLGGVV
jgi:hypothetical protein